MYKIQSENPVKRILADSDSNKFKVGVFVSLILVIIGCYVLAIFITPNVLINLEENNSCGIIKDSSKIYCSNVPSSNKWIGALSNLKNTNSLINFGISISLKKYIINDKDNEHEHEDDDLKFSIPFNYSINGISESLISKNSIVNLKCNINHLICENSMLFIQTLVNETDYIYQIEFYPDSTTIKYIDLINVNIFMLNSEYTTFMITLRYSLLFISIIIYIIFIYRYKKTEYCKRSYEHKLILILGIFLIMFNDPIFAATILTVKPFFCALSIIFVCSFLGFLVILWSLIILKIKDNPFLFIKGNNSVLRIIPGFLIFSLTIASGMIGLYYTIYQPAIDNNLEIPTGLVVTVVLTVVIALLLLSGLIWALVKIGKNSKMIPNRYYLFIMISIYFMVISFIFCIFVFYNPFDEEGGKLALIFLLFDFYVWYLMLLWSLPDFWCSNPDIQIFEIEENKENKFISANSSSLEPRVKDIKYNNSYQLNEENDKIGFSENNINTFSGNINFQKPNPRIEQINFNYMDKELGVVQEEDSVIKSDITGHGYDVFDDDDDNTEFKLKFEDSIDKENKKKT